MENKKFTQNEVNRIVTARVKRERERLTKEFENCLKRCMASVHLMLYQEKCSLKRNYTAETNDTLLSESEEQPFEARLSEAMQKTKEEVNSND